MINIKNTKTKQESINMIDFAFTTHTSAVKNCTMPWLLVELAARTRQCIPFSPLRCQATSSQHSSSSSPTLWGCTDPHQTRLGGLMRSRYQLVSGMPSATGKHTLQGFLLLSKLWGPSLPLWKIYLIKIWELFSLSVLLLHSWLFIYLYFILNNFNILLLSVF